MTASANNTLGFDTPGATDSQAHAGSSSPEVTRRQVLVGLGATAAVAATGMVMPVHGGGSLPAAEAAVISPFTQIAAGGRAQGIVVLVTLYGGNDGLDTLVPYSNSAYHAGRGSLAVAPDRVLPLDA